MKPSRAEHRFPWNRAKKQGLKPLLFCFLRVREFCLVALCLFASEAFAIPPNTDFTNTAEVQYQVGGTPFTASDSATLTTDPGAGNSAPYDITPGTFTVSENAVAATLGAINVLDLDPLDTFTWTVSDPRLEIVGGELRLAAGQSLDFESEASIVLLVTVTDSAGASYQETITVSVLDLNEAPTAINLTDSTVVANVPGRVVGELTTQDPDTGDSHTYLVNDVRFEVVGGQLKLVDSVSLPLGTTVDVTVTSTDSGGLQFVTTFTVTATPPGAGGGTDPQIRFLQSGELAGVGLNVDVALSYCDAGLGLTAYSDPLTVFGQPAGLPGRHSLVQAGAWKGDGAGFFELTDVDANLDSAVRDRVSVDLSVGLDNETIEIVETGVNTGTFVGFIPTVTGTAVVQDCTLQVGVDDIVTVNYADALDPLRSVSGTIPINPLSRVFASSNGQPINGASVRLLEAGSGQPANVLADDGTNQAPSTVVSGEATGPGTYRFPFVGAGDYVLEIVPPNRFAFPSTVLDADLQVLPNAPFVLTPGSRGNAFNLATGPAMHIDIPLDVLPLAPTQSAISVGAAGAGGVTSQVQPAQCFDGANYVSAGNPGTNTLGTLALPGNVPIVPGTRFNRGDALFVTLTDGDQDLDPFAPDVVEITVSVVGQVDQERVRLVETNDSTGVFVGHIQTSSGPATPFNCTLESDANSEVLLSYTDPSNDQDTSSRTVLLDPGFIVFSSTDGGMIDGATITLVDDTTGLPASDAVFAADGVTPYPTTVVSGGSVTDGAGQTYDFTTGTILFPVIRPGTYRLEVTPATSYAFPSLRTDDELNALPAGPFVLTEGSRGQPFTVAAGEPTAFDIPLDPLNLEIFVSKEASKDVVSVGDFLQYQILVENSNLTGSVTNTMLHDRLPVGLRFAEDSLHIDGQRIPLNIGPDGRSLSIDLGQLDPDTRTEIRYVVEVTVEASEGRLRNNAWLTGVGLGSSNVAFADVQVRNELFQEQAFIIGEVVKNSCGGSQDDRQGVPGVRIWMEDGTFVVTDEVGKYHIEDVEPGSHVVQIDESTLPPGLRLANCQQTSQHAGSERSQFVDLQPGGMWRVDFNLEGEVAPVGEVVTRFDAEAIVDEHRVEYSYRLRTGEVPVEKLRLTVQIDETLSYEAGSAQLNGQTVDDPKQFGNVLSFKLPDANSAGEQILSFGTKLTEDSDLMVSQAVLMFVSEDQPHRTDKLVNELGVNWPTSLNLIADSSDVFQVSENRDSLERARATNAGRLQSEYGRNVLPETQASTDVSSEPFIRGGVHEPSLGEHMSRSQTHRLVLNGSVPEQVESGLPYTLPEQKRIDKVDPRLFLVAGSDQGIAYPPENYNPVMPAIPVAVLHPIDLKPQLLVDGKLVNPLTFEGLVQDRDLGLAVSYWEGVAITENDSLVDVRLLNSQDETVARYERRVHFSGAPARAETNLEKSYLVADGINPPMIAVRLFDRAGYPLRAGTTGEFTVNEPYVVLDKTRQLENVSNDFNNRRFRVLDDGYAFIQLEPTVTTGEVQIGFQFDEVRSQTLHVRLSPGARDWILVGIAEASFANNDTDGNEQSLRAHDLEDDTLYDGRVAFYAKGMVKGEWLLTAAYDTDKEYVAELKRQVEPDQFYTLYGDGASQLHDAQSQRKLYLKVEKERFSSLFGDFETEFSRSELTRYERRLNGVNADYFGKRIEVRGFASEVGQAFVRDELPGDGTSGTYRLSRKGLVRFGEQVRIVTRDRFQLDEIIEAQQLTRYEDYSIDYDRGTLVFKRPIPNQDAGFNPVFVEVEYEVEAGRSDELLVGARAAYKLDKQDSEISLTYIRDESLAEDAGDLLGFDYTHQFTDANKLTLEYARSEGGDAAVTGTSDAFLVELEHRSEKLGGKVFVQEAEEGFGLGQAASFSTDLKKIGIEGEYRPNASTRVLGQVLTQEFLSQGTTRDILSLELESQRFSTLWRGGLRSVREEGEAGETEANQLLVGASRKFLKEKLSLSIDNEIDFSSGDDTTDYPSRTLLGAEYRLFNDVSLVAEQELSWADDRDTQDTRFGLRAKPWRGADVRSMMHREQGENGERLFATTGLMQQWRLSDAWLVDAGLDRVETMSERGTLDDAQNALFNPTQPPASGSFDQDFTALFAGATYQQEQWSASTRVEHHTGDEADKLNWLFGANRQLSEGRVVSASASYLTEELAAGEINDALDIRFAFAYRPAESRWSVFNRTDLVFDRRENDTFDTRTRKWVNNTHVNFAASAKHQVYAQLGLKYVVDSFDGQEFDGITYLLGSQYRYNFHPRWDLGVQGGVLHSVNSKLSKHMAGVSVGYSAFANSWISLGYNFVGFRDDDFVGADFTAKGPYVKLRLKFDQEIARQFLRYAGLRSEADD